MCCVVGGVVWDGVGWGGYWGEYWGGYWSGVGIGIGWLSGLGGCRDWVGIRIGVEWIKSLVFKMIKLLQKHGS